MKNLELSVVIFVFFKWFRKTEIEYKYSRVIIKVKVYICLLNFVNFFGNLRIFKIKSWGKLIVLMLWDI